MQVVQDYITAARILMQDTTAAPRYSDDQFKLALDQAFDEAYRHRPDFFIQVTIPVFAGGASSTAVPAPRGYQTAFLNFIVGQVQLQDQEETTDGRASAFLNSFIAKLLNTAA